MADYDVKAVAAALREVVAAWRQTGNPIETIQRRADELDPPPPVKSRADRIVDRLRVECLPGPGGVSMFGGLAVLDMVRRILKEEGIE